MKKQIVIESVDRIFLYARRGRRATLYSRGDHGQIYCGQSRSSAARVECSAGRWAAASGAATIIERTRRWRLQQKGQTGLGVHDAFHVTHQGSPLVPTAARPVSSLSIGVEPVVAAEAAHRTGYPQNVLPRFIRGYVLICRQVLTFGLRQQPGVSFFAACLMSANDGR